VRRLVSALARSCHPAPTVAVTVFATVLAAVANNSAAGCALVAAAVLAGQLSIGWSNDRLDRLRDRRAGRTDKPVAVGEISPRAIDTAIVLALLATVGLSLALGWRAGLTHLGAVACGWAYNLGVKATWWSWAPYALAFGALPAVAVLAAAGHHAPAGWAVAVGALLGVAANLTNALTDLDGDALTGVRGLPHRLGARPSLLVAATLCLAATVILALAPSGAPRPASWVCLGLVGAILAAGTPVALRRPTSRRSFDGLVALIAIDLALLIITGNGLR